MPSDKTAGTKHGWDYKQPAVTDDAKNKSSEVEIILEKQFKKQTMTTMGRSVNHVVELGMALFAATSIKHDEYTPSNYLDAAWSLKWREYVPAN